MPELNRELLKRAWIGQAIGWGLGLWGAYNNWSETQAANKAIPKPVTGTLPAAGVATLRHSLPSTEVEGSMLNDIPRTAAAVSMLDSFHERALAFHFGVDLFCKEAGFDEEDKDALLMLLKEAGTFRPPNSAAMRTTMRARRFAPSMDPESFSKLVRRQQMNRAMPALKAETAARQALKPKTVAPTATESAATPAAANSAAPQKEPRAPAGGNDYSWLMFPGLLAADLGGNYMINKHYAKPEEKKPELKSSTFADDIEANNELLANRAAQRIAFARGENIEDALAPLLGSPDAPRSMSGLYSALHAGGFEQKMPQYLKGEAGTQALRNYQALADPYIRKLHESTGVTQPKAGLGGAAAPRNAYPDATTLTQQ